jgi:carbon storage regulator
VIIIPRKKNETVRIADDISITVIEIRPDGKVRLGITGPKDMAVSRGEVYEALHGSLPTPTAKPDVPPKG